MAGTWLIYQLAWLLGAAAVYLVLERLEVESRYKWGAFFGVLTIDVGYYFAKAVINGEESIADLVELLWDWNFVNIGVAALIIIIVGSGLIRTKYKGVIWGVAIAVLWAALHVGIGRHEWGEVFFNGTLL
ncbi:hypothetical protein EPN96_04685 [bacterium]|nr:MAG: hypothetical protein EPN96_04685 [bacterium]